MTDTAKLAARAVEAVDDGELVKLLQRMIRIRSYSAGGEEAQIARFVQDCCATLGLESTLQEVQPGRFNVISRWRGTGGGTSLMLNGHLDTNPAGTGWTRFGAGLDRALFAGRAAFLARFFVMRSPSFPV